MEDGPKRPGPGVSRRRLLSLGVGAGLAGGVAATRPGPARGDAGADAGAGAGAGAGRLEIARLADLEPGAELHFAYPDENAPAVLLRLSGPAEGGAGPDRSLVAYSVLCTHKGCPVMWNAEQQMLICPCHWSSFDPAKGGRMIIGQASQGLPRITLEVDEGAVVATGVEGLIFGRQTNVL